MTPMVSKNSENSLITDFTDVTEQEANPVTPKYTLPSKQDVLRGVVTLLALYVIALNVYRIYDFLINVQKESAEMDRLTTEAEKMEIAFTKHLQNKVDSQKIFISQVAELFKKNATQHSTLSPKFAW